MFLLRKTSLCLVSALLLISTSALAQFADSAHSQGQKYTSIVVFGDSLSDTGNDADVTQAKYGIRVPGLVADYADGRFTDGLFTLPGARRYFGVWVEQLAEMLPGRPEVRASLNRGTNYAYGFATTAGGTGAFTFGTLDAYSVTVDNVGLQISDYLAHHPRIDDKTLFIVWGGAINVLYATSSADVAAGAVEDAADVQRLIHAGATQIIVPNLPPLGDTPELNVAPAAAAAANAATVLFNTTLSAGLDGLGLDRFHPAHIYRLDVFSLFQSILASPKTYGFDNVTGMSQEVLTVNPDTYLFWDDLHPTTHGHHILALTALKLADPEECDAREYRGEEPCDVHEHGFGALR